DYAAGDALLRGAGAVIVDEEGREVAYADDGTSQTLRAFAGSKTAVGELVPRPWAEVSSGPWRGERPASLKPGCAVEDAGLLSRAQGCLLGQIAGDNLGALVGYLVADSQANGSLMRASPLAILAHRSRPGEAAELGRRDSALTHPHPVCRDAVAAFVIATSRAIARGGEAEGAYEAALAWARSEAVAPVTETLVRAAAEAPRCDEGHTGWVLVTLQNAFHELLHAPSVEAGVV